MLCCPRRTAERLWGGQCQSLYRRGVLGGGVTVYLPHKTLQPSLGPLPWATLTWTSIFIKHGVITWKKNLNMNILWQAVPHPGICSTEIFTPNEARGCSLWQWKQMFGTMYLLLGEQINMAYSYCGVPRCYKLLWWTYIFIGSIYCVCNFKKVDESFPSASSQSAKSHKKIFFKCIIESIWLKSQHHGGTWHVVMSVTVFKSLLWFPPWSPSLLFLSSILNRAHHIHSGLIILCSLKTLTLYPILTPAGWGPNVGRGPFCLRNFLSLHSHRLLPRCWAGRGDKRNGAAKTSLNPPCSSVPPALAELLISAPSCSCQDNPILLWFWIPSLGRQHA